MPPLILTAKLDADSFDFFDALRREYFPPERNFLKAHITLFHHLPDGETAHIESDLKEICAENSLFDLRFPTPRFLGKGTAAEIEAPELNRLRATLADRWQNWLTPQDKQKFKPHITIQNKVTPVEARKLFEKLQKDWQPKTGSVVGLQLWRYLGGPWEMAQEFLFSSAN